MSVCQHSGHLSCTNLWIIQIFNDVLDTTFTNGQHGMQFIQCYTTITMNDVINSMNAVWCHCGRRPIIPLRVIHWGLTYFSFITTIYPTSDSANIHCYINIFKLSWMRIGISPSELRNSMTYHCFNHTSLAAIFKRLLCCNLLMKQVGYAIQCRRVFMDSRKINKLHTDTVFT